MDEEKFREDIYRYCDNKVGEKVLFTGFTNFGRQLSEAPKDLATLTSKIINDLVSKEVLKKARELKDSGVPYGRYWVLPHERLVNGKIYDKEIKEVLTICSVCQSIEVSKKSGEWLREGSEPEVYGIYMEIYEGKLSHGLCPDPECRKAYT